jgi:hypothetical protein
VRFPLALAGRAGYTEGVSASDGEWPEASANSIAIDIGSRPLLFEIFQDDGREQRGGRITMAQTKERPPSEAKSPAKATPPNASAPRPSWLSRLRGPLTNAPTANGRPRTGGAIFKSFFGILIWFVASQLIMYLLILLDSALKMPGELPPLETTRLFPPNTPLLGWVTPFLLIYGVVVIGLWFLLIRFNLIPRDFFGARAQAEQRARRQGGTTAANTASTGPRKTRAQRRYSDARAQEQAQANAKGGKNGAKPAAKPVARASDAPKASNVSAGSHDEEYDQVRSAERLRRRRESKR